MYGGSRQPLQLAEELAGEHSLGRSRRVLLPSLCFEMLKVRTLQTGRLSYTAKCFEPILQATDGGGDEHIGVVNVREFFKIASRC